MAYGVNAPTGLTPVINQASGTLTSQTTQYFISASADGATTYGASIYKGDPVVFNPSVNGQGSGTIAVYPFNQTGDNAANATPVLGVFQGCEYIAAAPNNMVGQNVYSSYWPASTVVKAGTKIKAYVIDDPNVLFEIQVSTWTNVLNDARFGYGRIGQNFGFGLGGGGANLIPNNPATGNPTTGQSAVYLAKVFGANDGGAPHTLNTLPLRVISFSKNTQNLAQPISYAENAATTATFLSVWVQINNHQYRSGTNGIVAV